MHPMMVIMLCHDDHMGIALVTCKTRIDGIVDRVVMPDHDRHDRVVKPCHEDPKKNAK